MRAASTTCLSDRADLQHLQTFRSNTHNAVHRNSAAITNSPSSCNNNFDSCHFPRHCSWSDMAMSTGTELHEQMLCGCNRDLMPAKKPKAYPATSKPYYEKTRNPKHPQTQKASLVFLRCKQGVLGPGQLRRPAERPKSKLVMVCPTFASQFQSMTILFTTIIDMQRHCHHRRQSHIQFFSSTMNINTIAAFMIVNLSSTGNNLFALAAQE